MNYEWFYLSSCSRMFVVCWLQCYEKNEKFYQTKYVVVFNQDIFFHINIRGSQKCYIKHEINILLYHSQLLNWMWVWDDITIAFRMIETKSYQGCFKPRTYLRQIDALRNNEGLLALSLLPPVSSRPWWLDRRRPDCGIRYGTKNLENKP